MQLTAAGFLFDMDGTLVDSTPVVEAVWTEFSRANGLDPAEILGYAHGRQAIDTLARFLPQRSPAELGELLSALVAEEVARTEGIVEVPGAGALLAALIDAGAPVAVVTSAPRELAVARMAAAGVPVPPVLVAAEDVVRGKPDPQAYLLAAEKLGVPAASCLAFEDAPAGLAAAVASGARVVVVGVYESAASRGLGRLLDYAGELSVTEAGGEWSTGLVAGV
ncbi:phosphatase [Leifsonia xyli subsp. cynodontis DSM 46306]|uniref:Phosphatase n=1 Tax=Leifsonia xyli subsp. cynodontis DSM 46306 TaxID=1389489 RepID=U3PAC6_LEIXC|nr:HAD-IA family hydrolase [Leifsonia xyli]AGW42474.1 phosphatase [Leifsonia xyli subsp. cynodontis DSM 46306]